MDPMPSKISQKRKPWIETPLVESATLSKAAGCRVFLKLDALQPSGSFKSRGIGNFILTHLSDPSNQGKEVHFYISSGGNAGLAAVIAARDLGCPCTVVVPVTTKPLMIEKLKDDGAADVIQHGASWSEADSYLRERFINTNTSVSNDTNGSRITNVYVPPFDHPYVWDGHATLIPELVTQLPPREKSEEGDNRFPADVIVCSVGGGGLFNGIIQGLDEYLSKHPMKSSDGAKPLHVLAVETQGADSLAYSLKKGTLASLSTITSIASTLGAVQVAPLAFENARSPPDGVNVTSVVASDAEAVRGVVTFADKMRMLVEPACGVSVDVAMGPRLKEAVGDLGPNSRVVVIVCGGSSISPEMVAEYRQRLDDGWDGQ
ncbi:putative L-serine dehydratase [Talaromyces proteolyticus]|uniref:L-serine ammonia-lyase n=1 Tax=Talaromyces proteolyticus TaxID=1131652 RepID=A0AAD4KMQ8_9EURO|nr:putative L-serine dehydratase [Talaromyces proteolyticus]KAH8692755.1 putative L-serine dehydratase [Talaromyces proteolyticus]